MAAVKIDNFGGLNLKKDPKKGPFWSALKAENCFLDGNSLDVFYALNTASAANLNGAIARNTIYNLDGTTFLEWTQDVDVAASPLADKATKRVYYTGDGEPRATNLSLATSALQLDGQEGLVAKWTKAGAGDGYFFQVIANAGRVILADDYLEYDVWIGTSSPAPAVDTPYLKIPAANISAGASLPDSASNSITGDIEVWVDFNAGDYGPSTPATQLLLGKVVTATSQRSYKLDLLDGGTLRWATSVAGTAYDTITSATVTLGSVGLNAKTRALVKVTHQMNDGAGNNVVKFWYSTNGGATWTQLGATVTNAGTTSIFDGTAPVTLSDQSSGAPTHGGMLIYRAKLFNGIGGVLAADFNPGSGVDGAATLADGVTGTWSIGSDSFLVSTGASDGGVKLWANAVARNDLADADGYRLIAPATAFDALARGKWKSRKIALGSLAGQTIGTVSVGGENDATGTHAVIYRKMRITNGAGIDRQGIWPPTVSGAPIADPSSNQIDAANLTTLIGVSPAKAYPAESYVLGLPVPTKIRSVTSSGGAGTAYDRAYVYTHVTPWGEEGPPSEPVSVVTLPGATVTLDGIGVTARNMLDTESQAGGGTYVGADSIALATFVGTPVPGYMEFTFNSSLDNHIDYAPGDRCYLSHPTSQKPANTSYLVSASAVYPNGGGVRIAANVWDTLTTSYLFRVPPINRATVLGVTNLGNGYVKVSLSAIHGLRVGEQVKFADVGGMTDLNYDKALGSANGAFTISAVTPASTVGNSSLANTGAITVPLPTSQAWTSGGTMTRVAKHNVGQRRITLVEHANATATVYCDSTAEIVAGDRVLIIGVMGAYQLNGIRAVASVLGPGAFTVSISSLNAYTGGGVVCPSVPYAFDEYPVGSVSSAGGPYPTPFTWTFNFLKTHDLAVGDLVVGYDFVGAQEAWTVMAVASVVNNQSITVSAGCALSALTSGGYIAPCGLQSRKRIYRAATGDVGAEYLLVDEIPADMCKFTDTFKDSDLGPPLTTDDWIQPPADLISMQAHPHSFLQGVSATTMCQSEPASPHAWPIRNRMDIPVRQVVGLGITGITAVALTNDAPHLISGSDPQSMRRERMDVGERCTSKRSIVSTGLGVGYRGITGFFLVGFGGGGSNSTRDYLPESNFTGTPDVVANYWHNKVVWAQAVDTSGYLFDPSGGERALTQFGIGQAIYDLHVSPVDGLLWASYLDAGQAKRAPVLQPTATPARFDYETQYIRFDKPVGLGFLQLDFDWAAQSADLKAREDTIVANRRLRASAFAAFNDVAIDEYGIGDDALQSPHAPDTSLVIPTERYLKATVVANPDSADDMVTVFDDFVVDDLPHRMADGVKSDVWQVKLVGNCKVSAVMLASSIVELRQL